LSACGRSPPRAKLRAPAAIDYTGECVPERALRVTRYPGPPMPGPLARRQAPPA
jgi:hypothetical protein